MFKNIIIVLFLLLACVPNQVKSQQYSIWKNANQSAAICLQPNTNSEGLWVDCCFDADGKAFSGPHYPDPSENIYQFRDDTLFLYSSQSVVNDVVSDELSLRAIYIVRKQHADTIWVKQLEPVNNHIKTQLFIRVDTTCYMLSHYEYLYGWDILSDSLRTFISSVPLFTFLPTYIADSARSFCRMLDADGFSQYPIVMELQGANVLFSAYTEQTDISLEYTAACFVMGHTFFFRYDDFASAVQPLADSVSVPSCERTIVYTNGFKKVERDCISTYSPPLCSFWFVKP